MLYQILFSCNVHFLSFSISLLHLNVVLLLVDDDDDVPNDAVARVHDENETYFLLPFYVNDHVLYYDHDRDDDYHENDVRHVFLLYCRY